MSSNIFCCQKKSKVSSKASSLTASAPETRSVPGSPIQAPLRVVLDIGGVKYTVAKSTLLKEESMLSTFFSGKFSIQESQLPDGSYFIDRDGEMFRYVMTYLRDGIIDPIVRKKGLRHALLREAHFFQLEGLIRLLLEKPHKIRAIKTVFPRCKILNMRPPEIVDVTEPHPNNNGHPPAPAPAHAQQGAANGNQNRLGHSKFTRMVVGGDRCIVGSSQGSIYVYSLRKRKLEADLRDHSDSVRCLVFKDNLLVSGGRDLKVQGHDVESGDLLFNLVGDHKIMITSIQVKDDYVVSGSLDGTVVIWDMWRQRAAHTLTLNNSVFSLHIVGRLLVTECGAAIYIYELATGKMVEELKEKEFVLFSEESRSLVYYQQKPQQFTLYDLDKREVVREWKKVTKSHIEVSTRQGDIFVTGSEDGEIHIYDLKTGKCQNQFTAHISFVGLHMVGDVLVSGAKDGKLFFWDIHTGARLRTLCHLRGLFAFKVVGNKIFCGYDDEVRIWTFEKPKEDIIDDDDDDNLYSDNDDDF